MGLDPVSSRTSDSWVPKVPRGQIGLYEAVYHLFFITHGEPISVLDWDADLDGFDKPSEAVGVAQLTVMAYIQPTCDHQE